MSRAIITMLKLEKGFLISTLIFVGIVLLASAYYIKTQILSHP